MKKVLSVLLALTLCFICVLTVSAEDSPIAERYYTVAASVAVVGNGTAYASPTVLKEDGDISTLTAVAGEGYVFDHWEIDGMYRIYSGDITDAVIQIQLVVGADNQTHGDIDSLAADIRAIAHFRPVGDKPGTTQESETAKPDSGSVAPQTGTFDSQATAIVVTSVIALIAVAFVYKKRSEKTK